MRNFKLGFFAGVLLSGLLSFMAKPPLAQAQCVHFETFTVPPGDQTLEFDAGCQVSFAGASFVMGGHPGLKISHIEGSPPGLVEFNFSDASPFDVTVYFVFAPFGSETNRFFIFVHNFTARDQLLEIGLRVPVL